MVPWWAGRAWMRTISPASSSFGAEPTRPPLTLDDPPTGRTRAGQTAQGPDGVPTDRGVVLVAGCTDDHRAGDSLRTCASADALGGPDPANVIRRSPRPVNTSGSGAHKAEGELASL